jgi:outer membrane protein OmpA-like peptidoglycan-associated protein
MAGAAQAQQAAPQDHTIDAQLFQPAIGRRNFLTVESAEVPEHKQLSFGFGFNYQRRPYIVYTQGTSPATSSVVDSQLSGELDASIGLFGRAQVGFGIPFTPYLSGDETDPMGAPTGARLTESGLGDIRVEGKATLLTLGEDEDYTLGVSAGLTLPTGKDPMRPYLGDKLLTGRIKALATAQLGKLRMGANLGVLVRSTSQNFATELGPQLLYSAAAGYQALDRVEVLLEAYGRSGLQQFDKFYGDVNPFEIDLALRWGVTSMWSLLVGGGRGLGNGIGAPQGRGFVAAAFNPDFRDRDGDGVYDVDDKCPDQPEDRDGYQDRDGCPDPDNDGDGIPDAQDKCPNEAEDFDQFEDEDGCPELDNDKDGIPDVSDACPNAAEDGRGKRPKDGCPSTAEDSDGDGVNDTVDKCPDDPEDKDGFEDEDGCPDPDNDGDGIPDNFDNCPNAAEDMDGFEDEDGCPDPDNDHDGISDAEDKCPLKPETLNGNKDDDGCPDAGPEIVRLAVGRIEVDERMGFATEAGKTVLRPNALQAVGLVAMVLRGHPDILKVRVEVHAEGVSKEETQRRADAIRDALAKKGVEASRIDPVGLGAGSPHVDFLIESTKPAPKAAPAAAPDAAPTP